MWLFFFFISSWQSSVSNWALKFIKILISYRRISDLHQPALLNQKPSPSSIYMTTQRPRHPNVEATKKHRPKFDTRAKALDTDTNLSKKYNQLWKCTPSLISKWANQLHLGKLTFPTQWWFGSDDWVSFRWSMVIFSGVKCLQRTWINARWRRNFLEPSPLPKHFLYPYSLLTCTPSLKELMYTPENKRLKPKQGPKRKRQNIDPNHQFLASSRSFLGVYQISIEPHTSRQKGQDFLGTPDARMWSHPPASWLEKFGAGKYPPWVGSTPHAGCNRQHQNSETFLDSGIPKIPTNQPSFETGILGGRSKSWGMSETPWGLKVFQLNGWFLFPLKKAMMTPTSPWIPHWIHQVLWQGVPFCEGLGGRGLVASFPVLVGTLTAWKKGRGKHVLIIEYGKCCRKKCESSGSKICTKDPNRMQGCEMQLIIKLGRSLGHPAATTLKTKKAGKDCSIINRLVIHSPLLCSAKSRWK